MSVLTATLTAADMVDVQSALIKTSNALRQAAVGGPGRALAVTVAADTAGTLTFAIPAHGGDPAQTLAISCSVA